MRPIKYPGRVGQRVQAFAAFGPLLLEEEQMISKSWACGLSAALVFSILFSSMAEAKGHHGGGRHGHRRCGMHSHIDYGTNRCVRNHY